jgi:hypothetical protein
MFASGVSTLVALLVLQLLVVRDIPSLKWDWPLFEWGVVVGLLGALCLNAVYGFAAARIGTPDEDKRAWLHRRRLIYTWAWLVIAVELGMLAAMFDLVWLILVVAGYIVLVFGAGALIVARKARAGSESS